MAPVTDPKPAERLIAHRYRLLSLIGHGSMGTVWRAYDEFLRRPVAVKEVRLPPGMPKGEADELRERTMREARAIAVLSHPNVVTLHDIAQEDGDPFVVMELVPGSSLAQLLRKHGPLDNAQAAAVADAVAAALQAAHQAGITHRDVKPANVLVAEDGRIKLADFGIARNISEHTLTSTGITLGSPAYIAPEVASGGEVTNAADLWSLGATLFAAVEGRAPYDPEGDVIATLLEVVNGDVPQPVTTGPMAELIKALMVKDTSARLSLAELRRRIYPLLPEPGTSAFTSEAIERAESESADVPTRAAPSKPQEQQPSDVPPLASDPGPLPFVPTAPVQRRRRGVPRTLIYAIAMVIFVAAAGGGFVLARVAADKPLLPTSATQTTTLIVPSQQLDPPVDLVARKGEAARAKGGGTFTIKIPKQWETFVEERVPPKSGPVSTRVHYLSPDGKYQVIVERFPGYYPGHTIEQYTATLETIWPGKDTYKDRPVKVLPATGAGMEQPVQLNYNTVDLGGARRTTIADVLPLDDDLWVVSLTVPTIEEDGLTDTFNTISPSFGLVS
jgi:serine/threonine protein kinase